MINILRRFKSHAARGVKSSRKPSSKLLRLEPLESRSLLAVLTDAPIVGAVTDTEAKVWFRTSESADIALEYSTNADLSNSVTTPNLETLSGTDFTGIHTLTGLQAETKYYYRFLDEGVPLDSSDFPSFTTFAPSGSIREFSFAVTAELEDGNVDPTVAAPAYAQIDADNPDFFLQIGDFDHREPGRLSKMRNMHRAVRSGPMVSGVDFAEHIADEFPVFHMWDDHDYGTNDGDKTFPQRANALQAFKEYYPTPTLPNQAGIWHSFSYAQAEFFMLDLRSQRDNHLDPDGADKSMLDGDNIANGQKDWLKAGLLNSTATWKFIITTVPFNPTVENKDGWANYPTEHQEILDFIANNNIEGVILFSSDMHYGGGFDDGTNAGLPELNIPHTNMQDNVDTTNKPGTWSGGIVTGEGNPGYALIRVTESQVIMQTKGEDGAIRQTFILGAAGPGEIAISGLGQEIASGDTTPATTDNTDFGSTTAASPVTHTFVIANAGPDVLSITNVQLAGANAGDFAIVQSPAASVAAGQSTQFQVRFTPGASGTRTASVTVSNTDANEGSYTFAIQGTGASTAFERIIDDGDSGYSRKNSWSDRTDAAAYQGDYDFSGSSNSTTTKATWSFSGLARGQYLVYATYVAGTDRSTAASYKLYDGGTREAKGTLNQRNAPNDNFAHGIWWEQLPTMSISRGLLEVKLDAGASGREVADAIRIVKVEAQQSQVLSFVETSVPTRSESTPTKSSAATVATVSASNSPSVTTTKTAAAAAADYSRRLHRRAKATDVAIATDEFLRELFVGRKRK